MQIDEKHLTKIINGEKATIEKYNPWEHYVLRAASSPLTKFFLKKGITADQTTWMSIWILILSIPLLSIGNLIFQLSGVLLIIFWTILDCVDGNIARYWNKPTDYGYFLDTFAGYFAYVVLFFMPGIMVINSCESGFEEKQTTIIILAAISTISYLFTRLIHQKHANIFNAHSSSDQININETKQKTSLFGIIYTNIMTFYGFPPVILMLFLLLNKIEYFIFFYFAGNVIIMLLHLYKLLLKDQEK